MHLRGSGGLYAQSRLSGFVNSTRSLPLSPLCRHNRGFSVPPDNFQFAHPQKVFRTACALMYLPFAVAAPLLSVTEESSTAGAKEGERVGSVDGVITAPSLLINPRIGARLLKQTANFAAKSAQCYSGALRSSLPPLAPQRRAILLLSPCACHTGQTCNTQNKKYM